MAKKVVRRAYGKTRRMMKKQTTRRKKLHPTRRKQQDIGVLMFCVTAAFFAVGGTLMIVAACFSGVASVFSLIASASSPPAVTPVRKPASKATTRNTAPKDKRVHHGTMRVGITGRVISQSGKPKRACGAACQMSAKPPTTCDCSCGGSSHGKMRSGGPTVTKPRARPKPPARKRPAPKKTG